jgi:hypothetical protein
MIPWIFLIILCTRTLAVCYFTAKINDESLRTAQILHDLPDECGLMDVMKFQQFLASKKIALSGMGLFWMTKQIILTVIYSS